MWDQSIALIKNYMPTPLQETYHAILGKLHPIYTTLKPHREAAARNIQSTMTAKDAWLIDIMTACHHVAVAAWMGYFAMRAYALFIAAPGWDMTWSGVSLMVASSCLDLVLSYAVERGSTSAKLVVLSIWVLLQGTIGMALIESREFKGLLNALRGD